MNNSLYPPIIATYMPAFTEDVCKVYFNLADYQGTLPAYVLIIVNDLLTNESALSSNFPLGIMQLTMQIPDEGTEQFNNGQYYITVANGDLKNGFVCGKYYRVQLRFSSASVDITDSADLVTHIDDYSEWSTICLIKRIHEPDIYIGGQTPADIMIDTNFYNIAGRINFTLDDDETLKNVKVTIKNSSNTIIEESDYIEVNRYSLDNSFSYKVKHKLNNGETYIVIIDYTSRGLYKNSFSYTVTIGAAAEAPISTLTVTPDIDNGCILISIHNLEGETTNFVLLRADSTDNFQIWQEILITCMENNVYDTFLDKTIEADVWYKYDILIAGEEDSRSASLETPPAAVIVPFDDVFLTTNDKQLKITLNNTILTFKYNIQETKTDTLGSRYPWVRRNANTYYRSFGLSGTIAYVGNNETVLVVDPTSPDLAKLIEINKNGLFETRDTLTYPDLYREYNIDHGIDDTNDVYLERRFREAVIEYLYNTDVKLYRSRTEGNILVRLMNVSLTPKRELGNFIYDFSCEAIEVDDTTIENYNLYHIQNIGRFINTTPVDYGFDYSGKITKVGEL